MSVILIYDGSFDGFLTAVFVSYEEKLIQARIEPAYRSHNTFFDESRVVSTDESKAKRVWDGILKKAPIKNRQLLYKAFLSENPGVENSLLYVIRRIFSGNSFVFGNYTDPEVLKISKLVKSVDREKHRMDAFVRFKLTKDNIYFATVEPDFNVLPLNAKHFKNRYADQQWIIYDVKRNYGLFYNLKEVNTITLDFNEDFASKSKQNVVFTTVELAYEELWKNYFKSTNIVSRKNMTLHLKHVPKRYWKYLSEKQD